MAKVYKYGYAFPEKTLAESDEDFLKRDYGQNGILAGDYHRLLLPDSKAPRWMWACSRYVVVNDAIDHVSGVDYEFYDVLGTRSIYLELANLDVTRNDLIENFVNLYGLLGIAGAWYDLGESSVIYRRPLQRGLLEAKKGADFSADPDESEFLNEFYRDVALDEMSGMYDLQFTMPAREPLAYFKIAAKQIRDSVAAYVSILEGADPMDLEFDARGLINESIAPVSLGLDDEWRGSHQPNVGLPTMLPTLFYQLTRDIGDRQPIMRCTRSKCQKFFKPSRPNNTYCSHACMNAEKQKAFRQRKREAAEAADK